MDQTANEIEAHIDRTRDRLGSNLRELEHRVDAATDWREHFRERPHLFLAAAFAGGVMLGNALRRPSSSTNGQAFVDVRRSSGASDSVQRPTAATCELRKSVVAWLCGPTR